MRRLIATSLSLVLTACAQAPLVNAKPGSDLAVDRWECEKEVAKLSQPAPTPTSYRTSCTSTGASTDCTTNAEPRVGIIPAIISMSGPSPIDRCLAARGWRQH